MRIFTLFFIFFSTIIFAQKKKKFDLDVVSNIDAKAIIMKPLGNNVFAKNLQTFYGFGFGGNLMTPINFGIGLDYNMLFSNVVYGKENLYGSVGSPTLTSIDVFLTHRDMLSEDFMIEEMLGYSYYLNSNLYNYEKSLKYKTSGSGLNLGAKLIYILTGPQSVFLAGKLNFYRSNVFNENADIQKFYGNSTFLSLSLGYRYSF